jgi:hypothetical protein
MSSGVLSDFRRQRFCRKSDLVKAFSAEGLLTASKGQLLSCQ